MKLLFDENLSPELVANLTSDFPDSLHVREIGLERATAEDVWGYARGNGFAIVTRPSSSENGTLAHSGVSPFVGLMSPKQKNQPDNPRFFKP